MRIDRRSFLGGSAGAVLLSGVGATRWAFPSAMVSRAEAGEQRILVLVQLVGGNDGLNWIVPHGHDEYYRARPSLSIPAEKVLAANDEIGFHPGCAGLHELWREGNACIVQGVGYPHPDRSHFRSMDIWDSAQPELETPRDGWIGRWLAGRAGSDVAMSALRVGEGAVPLSLISEGFEAPSLARREDLELLGGDELMKRLDRITEVGRAGGELEYLREASRRAWSASQQLARHGTGYRPKADYPGSDLARRLGLVARLIRADVGIRVYHVALGGFDTHAGQRSAHDALLQLLSAALTAFWRDLEADQLSGRALVMVYSEFGRRVAENGSQGTDHGAAAPVMVLAPGLDRTLEGRQPSLSDLDDGDLKHSIDFRSVYQTVLERWFESDSRSVLGDRFPSLGFLG